MCVYVNTHTHSCQQEERLPHTDFSLGRENEAHGGLPKQIPQQSNPGSMSNHVKGGRLCWSKPRAEQVSLTKRPFK